MASISVVIITKNEERIIEATVSAALRISDDVVVADNGSTDRTRELASALGARVETVEWKGYGLTKVAAALLARHDWILSLDADETPDEELIDNIQNSDLSKHHVIYCCRYRNFIGKKEVRYGEWKPPVKPRMFNRRFTNWDSSIIHEGLILPPSSTQIVLSGYLLHTSMHDLNEYASKMMRYGNLMAAKYASEGKKASWVKLYLYPTVAFFQAYILKLGLLDGATGFMAAKMSAFYAFYKYQKLAELNNESS